MSQKLQYALRELDAMERTAQMPSPLHGIDARAKLSVTLLFLLALLSMPLTRLSDLLLFFIYPIVGASRGGLSYALLMRRSLWVLPFVLLIGIFNPLLDRQPAFQIGSWWVSQGWVSFVSIVLRGLLSVQGVLLLVYTT
ncbi:MAG: energy-coupling factor transporter transmembrane component T, partial [Alistipes sp.]|nr:energy-coupling factor transporter transmembrane component T [Alistipes sp.]